MKHKGLHTHRLAEDQNNPREVAFASQWALENEYSHILEYLLGSNNKRSSVSDRDAEVAATIAQWLGSSVGMSFMREALKKCGFDIVEKRNEMSDTPRTDSLKAQYFKDSIELYDVFYEIGKLERELVEAKAEISGLDAMLRVSRKELEEAKKSLVHAHEVED